MKRLSILGSTGSIGRSALDVVRRFPDRFQVKALAAHSNLDLLAEQIGEFRPDLAVVIDEPRAKALWDLVGGAAGVEIRFGDEGYRRAAAHEEVDAVLTAVVGAAGLTPTLAAIDAGKEIALANKETLVMAGELVTVRAEERGVRILPVDSEHSAIFQCLAGQRREDVEKILLTASGGPFRGWTKKQMAGITPEEALRHPTWRMGPKITIDSATLMNKGLEVIEAMHLFGLPRDRIEVVIHPQSIVHSMVAFRDGTVMAQMGAPDMRGAIAYALSWPERLDIGVAPPDFAALESLHFERPDPETFEALALAFDACDEGGTLPTVLNAANEVAVGAFLEGRISFLRITEMVRHAMGCHKVVRDPALDQIRTADRWARTHVESLVNQGG